MERSPCLAHRINTTVEHSCEASVTAYHIFEILQELFVFFTSSPKRYSVFRGKVSEGDVENALDLTNLSATRWVARGNSIGKCARCKDLNEGEEFIGKTLFVRVPCHGYVYEEYHDENQDIDKTTSNS